MSIAIVDYGMGNLGSVQNAFAWLGVSTRLVRTPAEISGARALIFPGQGAWGDCMRSLNRLGFTEPLREWIAEDRPFLGICMGLQLLFESSEESPETPGLGVFPGRVRRFISDTQKVPQIGWNTVRQLGSDPLFCGISDSAYFYFVHSYKAPVLGDGITTGLTDYGGVYTSALSLGNLHAVQFHPEKSDRNGLRILSNFLEIAQQQMSVA